MPAVNKEGEVWSASGVGFPGVPSVELPMKAVTGLQNLHKLAPAVGCS